MSCNPSRIIVTGANLPPSNPPGAKPVTPPRLNICTLIGNEKQWSLYIQALTRLQNMDPANSLSWFAIMGIHGAPTELQWENAGAKIDYGYCTHTSPLFPTWHRPYLALYDQALQAAALDVAQKCNKDTDSWVRAALSLRSPYWDWADPETYLPPREVYDSIKFKTLCITTPDGKKDVPNPLLTYTFQRKINWDYPQPTTVRHPTDTPAQSIKAFEETVQNEAIQGDLQFACWKTLNWTKTWEEFSHSGATPGQRANSAESLHDWLHERIGGAGHMGDPVSAAFDPIFMLHHTNVDRLFALWQSLHPEVWIEQDINKDLTPFWKSTNAFHRSSDSPVREFTKFRNTYPEFVGLENLSQAEKKLKIQGKIDALYDPKNRRLGSAPQPNPGTGTANPPTVERLDWFIRIRIRKFQLKNSFTILFFLGPVPDDVSKWRSSPSLVGTHCVFVNSTPKNCGTCQANSTVITEGFIDLVRSLERLGYGQKTEQEIEKFIKDNIKWRIQKVNGPVVAAKELEVLEVSIMTSVVTDCRKLDVVPVHHNIISDKVGGRDPENKTYRL